MEFKHNQSEPHYTKGWYSFTPSTHIKKEKIYSFSYFGTSFICVRNSHHEIRIFDAYCPHMGAHLGVGGKIVNEQIICPFHGWQYSFSGECIRIPYCQKIPAGAKLRTYQSRHLHSHIYLFFGSVEDITPFEDELPLLLHHHFHRLFAIPLSKVAWDRLIAIVKLDFLILLENAGCVIIKYENSYLLITGTPINHQSIYVSFAFTHIKPTLLPQFRLKIKLHQKFRELIHKIEHHDLSISIHSFS